LSCTINASNSGFGGIVTTGDSSGQLQLQTAGTTALTIDTSQRAAFVAGTAALPAITTTGDTNTGMWFPAADTIAFSEGGAEAVRIDSSGNVGIGTTSPITKLHIYGSGANSRVENSGATNSTQFTVKNTVGTVTLGLDSSTGSGFGVSNAALLWYDAAQPLVFATSNTERMRIDSSGRVGINTASPTAMLHINSDSDSITPARFNVTTTGATSKNCVIFQREGTNVGFITVTNAATAYVTSSDYRLKENIVPMTGALDKVAQLNPVTYKWKIDGSDGQGFIAHELQAIVPDCVYGEKDAVDTEGNPEYQGVDTSFLVATLTAAIQEQQTIINDLKARVEALEAK
jgi:hypothetical protein